MMGSILDRVPGYAGYRDKERRRESDRAIRENLARSYGQLADRLGALATRLAEQREILAIPIIDKPYQRLTSFVDRVRTASYGYAPLFADAPVEEAALDQLAAFDRALADQHESLAAQVAAIEAADPGSAEFKRVADELTHSIEGLHARFDKRQEVIHAGKASDAKDVLALLETPKPVATPVAYRLHEHDALAYDGINYSITGRVGFQASGEAWRAFQLQGGSGDRWLLASASQTDPLYWMRRVTLDGPPGAASVQGEGTTYALRSVIEGRGDVIGASGSAKDQPVRFTRHDAAAGSDQLVVFDWGSGHLALAGAAIDSREINLFTRET
jgi:hypothetical protein